LRYIKIWWADVVSIHSPEGMRFTVSLSEPLTLSTRI
jgi:hypothetical protein